MENLISWFNRVALVTRTFGYTSSVSCRLYLSASLNVSTQTYSVTRVDFNNNNKKKTVTEQVCLNGTQVTLEQMSFSHASQGNCMPW